MSEELIQELALLIAAADAKPGWQPILLNNPAYMAKAQGIAAAILPIIERERQRGYAAGVDAAAAVVCQWEASDYDEACNTMCAQMLDDFRALKENPDG